MKVNPDEKADEIRELMDDVASDTTGVSREDYRAFLRDIRDEVELRLECLDDDDERAGST